MAFVCRTQACTIPFANSCKFPSKNSSPVIFLPEGQEQNAADGHLLHLLERRLYDASSKEIRFDEFQHSLKSFSEAALLLRRFETEQAAVDYLVSETGSPAEECASAYEIYRKMFD